LRINIDSANLEQAGRIVDEFKREEWFTENLKKGLVSIYYGHVRQYTPACRCDKEEVLKDGDFWPKEMELRRHLNRIGLQAERYPDIVSGCTATSFHSFVLDPEGNLYKCWNHLGIPGKSVGSIFKPIELNALHIAYLSEGFERDGECLDCRFLPICMGGCVDIRVKAKQGEFKGKNCSQWKYYLEECLRDVYVSSISRSQAS